MGAFKLFLMYNLLLETRSYLMDFDLHSYTSILAYEVRQKVYNSSHLSLPQTHRIIQNPQPYSVG